MDSAHVFGHGAADNDGHRIVGSGTVCQGHQSRDTHLGGLVALHHAAQLFDQPSDAAVVGDHLRHAAAEQGQEEDLVHAGETVPDALGKEGDIQIAKGQADDAGGEDADGQHQEHIHADQRQYQHGEVGNDLDDVERQISHLRHGLRPAYDQQHDNGDDSRRQGNEEVHPELVPELAALGAGGGNGGVGDHREVVAEHGAAHAGAQKQGKAQPALFRHAHSDRNNGADGAHGGAGGGAHERGDHEHAGGQEVHGNDAETQIHGGVHAAHGTGHGGEGAGQDVDHQHGQDVLVGGALGEDCEFLIDGALALAEGQQQGDEHGCDRGELVEGHLYTLCLEVQASA